MAKHPTNTQHLIAFQKKGLFCVTACPGSGKTYTVAARLARLMAAWQHPHVGIAVMSFTNVAWKEIEAYLAHDFNVRVPLGYPHYLGTIDGFLNRFVFLPHGHLVMGCQRRPELTGPPHNESEPIGQWLYWQTAECNRYGCRLNDFSYGDDGNLVHLSPRSHFDNCRSDHAHCSRHKRTFTGRGYATQADANFFALKVLQRYPAVGRAIALRFPVIMIDEAQDTSRTQMDLIDALVAGGVTELMLIGDPRQAIYEWRQAEPSLFQQKCEAWQDSIAMTENWRSTRRICAFAGRIGTPAAPMTAINPQLVECDEAPQIYGYSSDDELPAILAHFKEHCALHGIASSHVSILTRSTEFLNAVVPGSVCQRLNPWRDDDPTTRLVAHAKYLLDHGDAKGGLRRLELAAFQRHTGNQLFRMNDLTAHATVVGVSRWRGELFPLLRRLPDTNQPISAWVEQANVLLNSSAWFRGHTLAIKRDRRPNIYSTLTFAEMFSRPPTPERDSVMVGTIHSAKGRSLEAVFLALKTRGASGPCYTNLLGTDLLNEEELRIVYVAATRARRSLGIAVPAASLAGWQRLLQS